MINIATEIFREYDIRGEYPLKLSDATAQLIGQALGSEIITAKQDRCYVAWDGRLSSPAIRDALVTGLTSTGCDVYLIGAAPTAAAFWSIKQSMQSCAVITGSHNPKQDNGIKIAVAGTPRSGEDIKVLLSRIQLNLFHQGEGKIYNAFNIFNEYKQRLTYCIDTKRQIKIVLDAGNGIGGPTALAALKKIGVDVICIACDIDGNFPLHHPDPAKSKNLSWLKQAVLENNADFGIGLDGDADRIGVIDDQGDVVLPDRLSLLFVEDILKHQPHSTFVFDVKCTSVLNDFIEQQGGIPHMIATGHTSMKRAIRITNAPFATELSGHILFNDKNGLGVDDGIYAGLRLCQLISEQTLSLSQRLSKFPNPVSTEEIQLSVKEQDKFSIMWLIQSHCFKSYDIITVDGMRIKFARGWALVRASNTTPCLTLRFEADSKASLNEIQSLVMEELHSIIPELPSLPL
ncbi:MAG: phosphomannomutase [Crocinitomicaceae bacterium]|jgi:phosphomannomutase